MSGIYNGTIRFLNSRDGLAAIERSEDGLFSVIELRGGEVGVGDAVVGNLDAEGNVDLFNRTRHDPIAAVVRGSRLNRDSAIRALQSGQPSGHS